MATRTRNWAIAIAAILVVWAGGYAFMTRAPDATAYREMCVQSAQSALDGLATARMSTDEGLLSPYRTSMSDDAQKLIAQARSQMTGQTPPDERSAQRRDTLIPLLDQAERAFEDLQAGGGGGHLTELERQLRAFIDGNRG